MITLQVNKVGETGWFSGYFNGLTFQAKIYDEPSQFGINGGRISKLMITDASKAVIFNYDRSPDVDAPVGYVLAQMLEISCK